MRKLRPIVLSVFVSCGFASSALAQLPHMAIDIAAGGGFVGLDTNEVQTTPHTTCTPAQPPVCTADPANVVVTANSRYGWQPAVATGLVFRYIPKPEYVGSDDQGGMKRDGFGIGLGAQFVFVPHGDNTRAAPALTIHVGRSSQQVFFGWVFAPVDKVEIPGGGPSAIVPAGFQATELIRPDAGRRPQFFAGVVIGGVAVTQPK
jgi:hypothetical protein